MWIRLQLIDMAVFGNELMEKPTWLLQFFFSFSLEFRFLCLSSQQSRFVSSCSEKVVLLVLFSWEFEIPPGVFLLVPLVWDYNGIRGFLFFLSL